MEAGRARPDGRAAARRDGRLRRHQGRPGGAVRRPGGRTGRRPHQAGQAAVQHARGRPGRVLPQDAAGHGARRARDFGQAGRPPAQHAHHGRHAAPQMGPHQHRDARHLRAHRAPPGPERNLPRAAGSGLPPPAAVALQRAGQGGAQGAPAPARPDPESAARRDRGAGRRGAQRPHRRARENALLHLPQDGRKAPVLRPGERLVRRARDPAQHHQLLHGAGHAAPALQAGAGALQGLHRHPQDQRLPVAAHHAGRAGQRQHRVPDSHRGDGPGGRIRRGRALALQGRAARRRQDVARRTRHALAAVAARHPERNARRHRVLGTHPRRPGARRGVRLHAQGPDPVAAAGRHGGRLCLRHPQQRGRPRRRRQGQWRTGAAAQRTGQRRRHRDHHSARLHAQPGVARLCAHRPRAQQDSQPSEKPGAGRIARIGRKAAGAGAARRGPGAAARPADRRQAAVGQAAALYRQPHARGDDDRHRSRQAQREHGRQAPGHAAGGRRREARRAAADPRALHRAREPVARRRHSGWRREHLGQVRHLLPPDPRRRRAGLPGPRRRPGGAHRRMRGGAPPAAQGRRTLHHRGLGRRAGARVRGRHRRHRGQRQGCAGARGGRAGGCRGRHHSPGHE